MKCPNCNSIIPDDSKFCPDCGCRVIIEGDEVRNQVKELISNYKLGYEFYMRNGTLPRFVHNSSVANCEKILAYKQTIIQKHYNIVLDDKLVKVKECHDNYPKGYDNLASQGVIPYFSSRLSSTECDRILDNKNIIIQRHNKLVLEDKREKIKEIDNASQNDVSSTDDIYTWICLICGIIFFLSCLSKCS